MQEFSLSERKIIFFILGIMIFALGLSWFSKIFPRKSQAVIFLNEPLAFKVADPASNPELNPDLNPTQIININIADISQLQELPGVGQIIAQRIIEYRNACGSFQEKKDLMQVKGIGRKKFEKIKSKIKLSDR